MELTADKESTFNVIGKEKARIETTVNGISVTNFIWIYPHE